MSISFFDNFLQWYEIQVFVLVFERLFQAQNRIVSTDDYQTKLKKLQVNLKTELKKIFLWFFFPVKAEIPYFSDLKFGGPRGDLGKRYFTLKLLIFRNFLLWHLSQILKYSLHKSPRGPPNFRSEKYGISAFTGKKIIKRSFLVQFLSSLEVSSIWSGIRVDENIWFWVWNNLSNTRSNIWISYHCKKLSKKDIDIIFSR